jgi:hypothetical protein
VLFAKVKSIQELQPVSLCLNFSNGSKNDVSIFLTKKYTPQSQENGAKSASYCSAV